MEGIAEEGHLALISTGHQASPPSHIALYVP